MPYPDAEALAEQEVPKLCALSRQEGACYKQRGGNADGQAEVAHVEESAKREARHEHESVLCGGRDQRVIDYGEKRGLPVRSQSTHCR